MWWRCTTSLVFALLFLAAGCRQENPYAVQKKPPSGPSPKVHGVDPSRFDCQKFLSASEVAAIAGGEVFPEDPGITPAEGTPRPCAYILPYKMTEEEKKRLEKEERQRFEKKIASGEMTTMEEAIAAWGKERDKMFGFAFDCRKSAHARTAEWMKSLAGDPRTKPVAIGKEGIDHAAGQLTFVDDETPCVVTVSGPDEASRLALARLVHQKLTPENAPMSPRLAPSPPPPAAK